MNSLVKVPPYSKFNFQGKIVFTQNWCNITLNSINIISRNANKTLGKFKYRRSIYVTHCARDQINYITGANVQIWVNTLIVQLSTDTRMSVLLLGSSHINILKHYVISCNNKSLILMAMLLLNYLASMEGELETMTTVEDGRLIMNKSNQCILLFILVEMI